MFFDNLPHDPDRPPLTFKEGVLTLSGNCMPENSEYTLGILFAEIFEYLKFHDCFTILFKFSHITTTPSSMFLSLISRLNELQRTQKKKKIIIYWYSPHVDEDISELGEFYRDQSAIMAKKGKYKPITFKLKFYEYE
jgi:hypothetical protein